jgi:hypothetical protein
VCLDLGPGIRTLEIDDAIRATLIAAVQLVGKET